MRLSNVRISTKFYGLIGGLLAISVIIATIGAAKMQKIGLELEEVAEVDIPLTNALMKISLHQLEQSIALERSLRFGEEMQVNENAIGHFKESKHRFEELAAQVDKELREASVLASEVQSLAHSAAAKAEFARVTTTLREIAVAHDRFDEHALAVIAMLEAGEVARAIEAALEVEAEEDALNHRLEEQLLELAEFTAASALKAERDEKAGLIMLLVVSVVAVSVGAIAGLVMVRSTVRPIGAVTENFAEMDRGNFDFDIAGLGRGDEIGQMAGALSAFRDSAVVAARSQSALEGASACFMMADADYNIVYTNDAARRLFERREAELRQQLPNLDAKNLIGTSIDVFHKNPSHQRGILDGLRQPHESRLAIAGLTFDLVMTPAFSPTGARIGTAVQWTDITEKLAIETEAARAKATMDSSSTNFMISDADYNIVYVNKALIELFRSRESDIRKELPAFDLNTLIGTNIDVFHKNPSHQRGILEGLRLTHRSRIAVAGLTFDLVLTPVFGADGERVGTSVEWTDITAQLAVEEEVAGLVASAGAGDFSRRLAEDGKQGFMLELAKGMNELVATVDRGLNETVSVMSAMAQGDLTRRIEGDYRGTFLKLKDDSNQMAEKISGIAKRIVAATGTVSDANAEIAAGAGDLSSRTEQQASSLEETAASMEQLSATVRQNADNAQQANQLAVAARDAASNGGEVVASAVDAMGKIEDSSKQITEIMGMIDEIAFQTNLLALNAAVEAARAGEAGKGFAVVATEVRALAQRSGRASKEIKDLISNSDSQVRDGVGLVQKAGTSLEEIVTSVRKVADIISDIAAASKEQASGIDEVGTAVTNMDEMTQQNAALVEETTAALHSMTGQTDDLKKLVRFFKTGEEEGELDLDAAPAPALATAGGNPVHRQQKKLETKVATVGGGGGAAAAAAEPADDDWEEF